VIGRLSRSDSASAPGLSTSRRNPLGSDFAEIFNPREWIAGIRWFHRSHRGFFGVNGGYNGPYSASVAAEFLNSTPLSLRPPLALLVVARPHGRCVTDS
jgi:hypothetical protein